MTSSPTKEKGIAGWLTQKCREQHLSLRQAAAKASISHTTLTKIKNGSRPTAATISKLAEAFSNDGPSQRAALEDHLLTLCGYRTTYPEETERSEPLARLIDKLSKFDDEQLRLMEILVDFCTSIGDKYETRT
jgi:transcriptional regulator with XRE-family HTH domain